MVAESAVPPASGHGIPSEVDLEAPEAVLKWMSTFGGETYEEYGKKIVAAHYDSMHTLNFTEEELTQLSIPKPHARRIVAAAQGVTAAMAAVAGGAKSGSQATNPNVSYNDWESVSVPAFPKQSSTDTCGIGGMPSVSTMGAYFDRMAGAVRAVSAPLANAITAIKVNPEEVNIESLRGEVNFEQGKNDPCIFHKKDLTVVAYVEFKCTVIATMVAISQALLRARLA